MENLEFDNQNEEISLVDLFAVCVHYRYLIIIGTLLCTLFAGLYVHFSPKYKAGSSNVTYTAIYNLKAASAPKVVMDSICIDSTIADTANTLLKNPQFLAAENKICPAFGGTNLDDFSYNAFCKSLIESKTYFVDEKVKYGTRFAVTLKVSESGYEYADSLINQMLKDVDATLKEIILPVAANYKLPEVEAFVKNTKEYISMDGTPFVTKTVSSSGASKKKTLVIAFLAGFFLTVFLAFVINAVKNMKNDSEVSSKLSSAWKAGKIRK